MKKIFLLIVLLSCNSLVYGQSNYEFLIKKANNVDIVVEGKIISKRGFYDSELKFYFTEYEVEVSRQFKGEVTNKLYFYIHGGVDESGKGQLFSHSPSISINRVGVFFLKFYTPIEKPYLMPAGDKSILRYDYLGNRIRAYVHGYEFNDLESDIYASLEKCKGCYNKEIKK